METLRKTITLILLIISSATFIFAQGTEFTIDGMTFGMPEAEVYTEDYDGPPVPGETIQIVLEVKSNMPKTAMAHNIAVVDLDVNVEDFVLASMQEPDNEYISPSYADDVIAATEMIGGGETSAIEFTVPATPGDYEYVCTFPGHYFGGMKGVLRVSETS